MEGRKSSSPLIKLSIKDAVMMSKRPERFLSADDTQIHPLPPYVRTRSSGSFFFVSRHGLLAGWSPIPREPE
jgi:hypothetical protein